MKFEIEKPSYSSSFLIILNILFILLALGYTGFLVSMQNTTSLLSIFVLGGYLYMQKGIKQLYNNTEKVSAYFVSFGAILLLLFLDFNLCLSGIRIVH